MSETAVSESPIVRGRSGERGRFVRLLLLEALVCTAAGLMMAGIFFYTQSKFGWGAHRNLLLCTGQGVVYVIGALAANPISKRIGRRSLLRILEAALAILSLAAVFWPGPAALVAIVLAYVMLSAVQWPVLESLAASGVGAAELSRRISVYNLVWSGTGALAVAGCGPIIAHFPQGIFVVALGLHAGAWMVLMRREEDPESSMPAHVRPEPELVPLRTLAMRLSRMVLPATYAVSYALTALMPTLPVVLRFGEAMRPVVGSVWMMARCFSFVLLGAGGWWHTRPRLLLGAAVALLFCFLGCALTAWAGWMIPCQIGVGLAAGTIYSGSLYFGMVLSSGSAEQGGYHEALIGLGSIVGPGAGALAEAIQPGNQNASVIAVAVVLWISVMAAAWVSLAARRKA